MDSVQLDEEAIFDVARKITDREARAFYLAQACGGDAALVRRVERLVRVGEQEANFLIAPTSDVTVCLPAAAERPGVTIGPYKLLEPIGEGGMGTVYMAEQAQPVRRKVALKLIKSGMDSKQVVARFEAERQALALMDHPNIARVLDAGATDSGSPYFVMELVRGVPITEFCDREQLPVAARLELFVLVCRAVQHAHQKGVIHRDLKPSNVLVTLHDGVPVPKVIDFGIAKATGQSLTDKTLFTGFAQLVGTPLYMSPEQAEMSGLDVDTRSDIYSLGVLLYELLTGTTPFDSETLRRAAFDEMRRIIREVEPPTPSTRLSTLGLSLSTVSTRRGSDPRRLNRAVRGELDWIAMKALEKDRRRRYETASDFAADVMRYLTDQAVEACPPSARYRLGKYARRHRAALTAGALVALALFAGTAASAWQAFRATRAERRAAAALDDTGAVLDFLVGDIFGGAAPENNGGRVATIHDILTRGEGKIAARFGRRPPVEASARHALGEAYFALGDYHEAERQYRLVVQLRSQHFGPEAPQTVAAQATLVRVLNFQDTVPTTSRLEAEKLARRASAFYRRALGPHHPETIRAASDLGDALFRRGQRDEARKVLEGVLADQARVLGPDHPDALRTLHIYAKVLLELAGDLAGSEAAFRRGFEDRRRTLGPDHPDTLTSQGYLGAVVFRRGRQDEGIALQLEATEGYRRNFGPNHIRTSGALGYLMRKLRERPDPAPLRDLCQRWLREILGAPPGHHPYERERRAITLIRLVRQLVTLPRSTPFDGELAVRAAEDAAAISEGQSGGLALALAYDRVGQAERAMQAARVTMARPDWEPDGHACLVLALVHAHGGELEEARGWFAKLPPGFEPEQGDAPTRALYAEAAALLGTTPGADEVAR
ncbi:serine/threonine-protein kinase [Isosphaeraceae bacterium EP7]